MHISRRRLITAFSSLPAASLLRAAGQQDQQATAPQDQGAPAFSSSVKVVNVFATVRDKKGQIVKNLTKDDFMLDEDGRAQKIKYFSQESNLPLTLGLLVDTSGSMRRVLEDERVASRRFFQQVLRPDRDLAFVIHFDWEVELLEDLTADRDKLDRAIDALQEGDRRQQQRQQQGGQYPGGGSPGGYPGGGYPGGGYPGGGYPGGGRRPRGGRGGMGGGTDLYDAVYLGANDIMTKQKGRKAIVLMSDGEDTGSKTTLAAAIESSLRSDTLVYSILIRDSENGFGGVGFGVPGMGRRGGMGYPGGGGFDRPDGKKVMQQLAQETGGRFFEVSKRLPVEKVFEAIQEDLRNQYSIGYSSDAEKDAGSYYRRIHLMAKNKNLVVTAREGYYPGAV
jgi:VWFA-related protein